MFINTLRFAAVILVAMMGAAHPLHAQGSKSYKARLAPVPMTTAMASTVAGLGSISAQLNGSRLTITGKYDDLKSPATIAQLHRAPRGMRGPVVPGVPDLTITKGANGGTSGTLSVVIEMTPALLADLEKNWLYIQLHSEKAPDGNLWGWLMLQENRR